MEKKGNAVNLPLIGISMGILTYFLSQIKPLWRVHFSSFHLYFQIDPNSAQSAPGAPLGSLCIQLVNFICSEVEAHTHSPSFSKSVPSVQKRVSVKLAFSGKLNEKRKYCKRGYFRAGKISRKCKHNISCWGYFHNKIHVFIQVSNMFLGVKMSIGLETWMKTLIIIMFHLGLISISSHLKNSLVVHQYRDKKKEIWPSPMTKPLIPTENSKFKGQHTNATKNFDYTTIADRLRTVSWSNKSSNWCG